MEFITENIQKEDLMIFESQLLKLSKKIESRKHQKVVHDKIVVITSGGTSVKLSSSDNYSLENFATGGRGSKLAQ